MLSAAPGLSGVRVIDLTRDIAGAYCAFLLGTFGAEVIKIEPPGTGDPSRQYGPFPGDEPHPERSAAFLYRNRSKCGVTLDVDSRLGIQTLLELVQVADIVVTGMEPASLRSKGLDYETLRRHNPSVIVTAVSNFGQTGPYKDFKGGELVLDALGGWTYLTGYPDRMPLKPGMFQAQYLAGINAAIHTVAAVNVRQSTGAGRTIDVSVMETAVQLVGRGIAEYGEDGSVQVRSGSRTTTYRGGDHRGHPTDIYECADGYVAVAVQREGQWEMFALALDIPELRDDPRFCTDATERGRHADELNELVAPWFKERSRKQIFSLFGELRVPCGMVYTAAEILDDPQHEATGFITEMDHPQADNLPYPGSFFHGDEFPWRMRRAPLLAEHNPEVYGELLGCSSEDMARLSDMGAI